MQLAHRSPKRKEENHAHMAMIELIILVLLRSCLLFLHAGAAGHHGDVHLGSQIAALLLEHLDLGANFLSGQIPKSLGNLTKLNILRLYRNNLSRPIPHEICLLSNLSKVALYSNLLSGTIPPSMGNLTMLNFLYLHGNQFVGSIPPEIGTLVDLDTLSLYENKISGSIPFPATFTNLTSIRNLYLFLSKLLGSLPRGFANLTYLIDINLANNSLSGGTAL